jgi:hypothetical protein
MTAHHRQAGTARAPTLLLGALLALLLLWPASEARAQAGGGGSIAVFAFLLDQSDDVAIAMAQIWNAQFLVPSGGDAASGANAELQARVEAEAVVRANRDTAALYLVDALRSLSPEDADGLSSLGTLLRMVGEQPEILDHFQVILMQDAPSTDPAGGAADSSAMPDSQAFRFLALELVEHMAGEGSEPARENLLELLQSPDPAIRSGAVHGLYKASSSRRRAQREMRPRLDPDEHYLLYRH